MDIVEINRKGIVVGMEGMGDDGEKKGKGSGMIRKGCCKEEDEGEEKRKKKINALHEAARYNEMWIEMIKLYN